MHNIGVVRDIHCMVAQTLKFRHDLVVLVEDRRMLLIPDMREVFHYITADAVREHIDILFLRHDLIIDLLVVVFEQSESLLNIRSGQPVLHHQGIITAAERQSRRIEEPGVEGVQVILVLVGLHLVVRNHSDAASLKEAYKRSQHDTGRNVEDRVGVCDHAGIDHGLPDPVKESKAVQNGDTDKDQRHLADIEDYIYYTDSLLVCVRAYKAHDTGRHAVAEIYADNDRVYSFKSQYSRSRKGLQDTDRR